jgi:hypothetical protein
MGISAQVESIRWRAGAAGSAPVLTFDANPSSAATAPLSGSGCIIVVLVRG